MKLKKIEIITGTYKNIYVTGMLLNKEQWNVQLNLYREVTMTTFSFFLYNVRYIKTFLMSIKIRVIAAFLAFSFWWPTQQQTRDILGWTFIWQSIFKF